jgi:hypothetical protein
MIHRLLGLAFVVFVVWLVLQGIGLLLGGLLHLLWLVILAALVVWLWRRATGCHETG